jgi:hypothetical protein
VGRDDHVAGEHRPAIGDHPAQVGVVDLDLGLLGDPAPRPGAGQRGEMARGWSAARLSQRSPGGRNGAARPAGGHAEPSIKAASVSSSAPARAALDVG